MKIKKTLVIAVCILIASIAFAGSLISFNYNPNLGLLKKSSIGNSTRGNLRYSVRGTDVNSVYGIIGGVLFQATAEPEPKLKGLPISLLYELKGDFDATLKILIGKESGQSTTPAWIWVKAAKFADSGYTSAITLFGEPETEDEVKFHKANKVRYWISYHPDLDDTIIGLMIFGADSMFVSGEPNRMRRFTDGLNGAEKYIVYDFKIDEQKSLESASILKNKIKRSIKNINLQKQLNLDETIKIISEQKWNTYMLNDVNEQFTFRIENKIILIDGVPNYHFGVAYGDTFDENILITQFFRENRKLLHELNPLIYKSVDDFAKHVAFFNFVKDKYGEEWKRFLKSITVLEDRIPKVETPAAWTPSTISNDIK